MTFNGKFFDSVDIGNGICQKMRVILKSKERKLTKKERKGVGFGLVLAS